MKRLMHIRNQKGFTILELMISTAVFSVILLVCLSAIVYVGRLYYKGLSISQTQSAARDTVNSISNAVKFSREQVSINDVPTADWDGYVCVGTLKYSYNIGQVLVRGTPGQNQTNQALVESTDPDCGDGAVDHAPRDDNKDIYPHRELLGEFMRLNDFVLTSDGSTGLVTIDISIAYGGDGTNNDSELFITESVQRTRIDGSIENRELITACATGVPGGQFCALSNLSKSVKGVIK